MAGCFRAGESECQVQLSLCGHAAHCNCRPRKYPRALVNFLWTMCMNLHAFHIKKLSWGAATPECCAGAQPTGLVLISVPGIERDEAQEGPIARSMSDLGVWTRAPLHAAPLATSFSSSVVYWSPVLMGVVVDSQVFVGYCYASNQEECPWQGSNHCEKGGRVEGFRLQPRSLIYTRPISAFRRI